MLRKPWDIYTTRDHRPSDEFYVSLWRDFKPFDFLFSINVDTDAECAVLHLVPKEYFNVKGTMFDDSIPIVQYLPPYLEEVYEASYLIDADFGPAKAQADMISRGFCMNKVFDKLVDDYYSKQ
jgi:hypothetical protein